MNVIDLRMGKLLTQIPLMNEEITSACLNQPQDALVVGFKDSTVKVLNLDNDFEVRESTIAFPPIGGKKNSITKVGIHVQTGGIYVSSNNGIFKLFRTRV